MKKHLPLFLLLFAFAGFVSAQGPASTANWFGYILPSSPGDAFEYDFSDQAAGVYIIKVETAKGSDVKQVMLVK